MCLVLVVLGAFVVDCLAACTLREVCVLMAWTASFVLTCCVWVGLGCLFVWFCYCLFDSLGLIEVCVA